MKYSAPATMLRRATAFITRHPDRFLAAVTGVVHVGANTGQERKTYAKFGLQVLWVEPIPEVFTALTANIASFPRQRAVQCLLTDREDGEYIFHVASNGGASSSILDFQLHKDIWPQVTYERELKLRSTTLSSLMHRPEIDAAEFQALVMDTQGSELLVLKGGEDVLGGFRYVKTEVPDFESYQGCCQLRDMDAFLTARGFCEYSREQFARHAGGGSYYNIVYERRL